MRERRRRVLVVEDDRALADMYRTALRFSGFDVDGATDGVSAPRLIDQSVPDVASSTCTCRASVEKRSSRRSPIVRICVTGADPYPAVAQAAAILRKPCPPERLLSIIDRVSNAA